MAAGGAPPAEVSGRGGAPAGNGRPRRSGRRAPAAERSGPNVQVGVAIPPRPPRGEAEAPSREGQRSCARVFSSSGSGRTKIVLTRSGTTAPFAAPRGFRTYFRKVQSTGTLPEVRALE